MAEGDDFISAAGAHQQPIRSGAALEAYRAFRAAAAGEPVPFVAQDLAQDTICALAEMAAGAHTACAMRAGFPEDEAQGEVLAYADREVTALMFTGRLSPQHSPAGTYGGEDSYG